MFISRDVQFDKLDEAQKTSLFTGENSQGQEHLNDLIPDITDNDSNKNLVERQQ